MFVFMLSALFGWFCVWLVLVHCFARWEEEETAILPKSTGPTARKMRTMKKMDDRPGFSLQIEKAMCLPQSAPTSHRANTASTSGHHLSASLAVLEQLTSSPWNNMLFIIYYSLVVEDLTSSGEKRRCCYLRGTRPSNGVGKVQGKRQINLCKYGKRKCISSGVSSAWHLRPSPTKER